MNFTVEIFGDIMFQNIIFVQNPNGIKDNMVRKPAIIKNLSYIGLRLYKCWN